MEATAVSMGKAVLDGALGYAKSKAAEEIALQLGVERDVDFITDELYMMQSFLEMADEDNGQNKVFMAWVKQIRDLAYKVEDSLMDFGLHSEKKPFWGCIPHSLSDRRRIAKEVKELRAKVEDVSNRNLRYHLVKDHKDSSASNATAAEKHANIAITAMLGINEATLSTLEQEKSEVDLHQLITSKKEDLRVIALWGTSGDHGKMSAIQKVYGDPEVLKKFGLCAWVRLMHPFSPQEFFRSLVRQFYESSHDVVGKQESETNVLADSVAKMEKMDQSDLIRVLSAQLRSNSYLIVINELSTIEEWHCIKKYFPNNKKQSRIIVSTQNVEIASLCTEKPYQVSELRQLSCDQTIYLFHEKNMEENNMTNASMATFATNEGSLTDKEEKLKVVHALMPASKIQQEDERSKALGKDKVFNSTATKKFNRSKTLSLVDGVLTGRETEKSTVIKLVGQPDNNQVLFRDAIEQIPKQVSKDNTEEINFVPAMMEQARIILKKCDGLPLAISTIGGFLATKPKTAIEWRMMNDRISAELQINPELRTIKTVLMRSYDGLPYYLKSAFLYLSIFQEDQIIKLDRLVRRWIAEGYTRAMHGITAEQLGHRYFEELLDRSMILPGEDANHHDGKINSCQLHDIIREICISKAREENLVFTLEDGCCLSSTQGPIRHLVIGSNWKRDGDTFPTGLDLSHVRSLTVFGAWRPFFLSENMRFLRVLDLEDTLELRAHHLDPVEQLHHLKYLSIRGCINIYYLPKSVGNLRHLQSLDVRDTQIVELPTTITNLGKLQNLRASPPAYPYHKRRNIKGEKDIFSELVTSTEGFSRYEMLIFCCTFSLIPQVLAGGLNRREVRSAHRSYWQSYGVKAPRGIGQLNALHTLDCATANLDKGSATVKEFSELTELCKLGVGGIRKKNSMDFWSAIAGHYHLRSLTVREYLAPSIHRCIFYDGSGDELDGCLGKDMSPPSCLESLKLYGKLVRLTDWIPQLQNLRKLVLEYSRLEQDDAIQALGVLPNLEVLRLMRKSFLWEKLHFQKSSFPSLVVLELYGLDVKSLLPEEDAMPRLKLLQITRCRELNEVSGLSVLTSLKEIRLKFCGGERFMELVRGELGEDLKHVIVHTI